MRPPHLKNPTSIWMRLKLRAIAFIMGVESPPEPLYLFLARPEFAKGNVKLIDHMHSPQSHWSAGARELMATHVSARFQCPF